MGLLRITVEYLFGVNSPQTLTLTYINPGIPES